MATLDIHIIRFHVGFDLPQAKVQEAWEKGEKFKVFAGGPETTIRDLPKWRKDYDTICVWYGNEYKQRFNIDIRERWSTESPTGRIAQGPEMQTLMPHEKSGPIHVDLATAEARATVDYAASLSKAKPSKAPASKPKKGKK